MTDEEKAEEYVLSHKCTGSDFENSIMYESYIDGLTEGRKEKWHDLRKNPSDLPKNRENVLLYVKLKCEREVVLIGYRDFGECLGEYCQDWGDVEPVRNIKCDFVDGEEVIAWCELPKFEE